MKLTSDLAYLLGIIGGDGTIYVKTKKQYLLSISDKCKEFHEKVLKPSTKHILMKRKYRGDQKEKYGISWNGIKKCSTILKFMRHPEKIETLKSCISSSGRPI